MSTDGQMPLFAIEPEPGLQHLAIEREPDITGERRRKEPPPPPPRVIGRGGHGGQVAGGVQGALEQVQATRAAHGIAPDRLLVLGFRSWDSGVREILEGRLGGTVVDEQVETRNKADQLCYSIEKALSEVKGKLPADKVAGIESQVKSLRSAIEKEDHEAIKSGTESLEKAMSEVASMAYGAGGGPGGPSEPPAGAAGGGKKGGDVIDAEFEETN